MCPLCVTDAALVVAGATSSAGVVSFVALKLRTLRRQHRERRKAQLDSNIDQGEKREPGQR
jgi:hypothetical protein